MRLSARFLWFQLHIDTTPATDLVDVEHIATVTAYNTVHRELEATFGRDCDEHDQP